MKNITTGERTMSKNIIYCYSGSGNCLDMAKRIGGFLGDTDIVMMRRRPVITDARGAKRVGFIFPCYGGGLPGNTEEYIREIKIDSDAYKFAIVQYAGYMGCGLHKIDEIIGLDYWNGCSHHSSCIWLMPHYFTMPPMPAKQSQQKSERKARSFAEDILTMKKSEEKPPKRGVFAVESAFLSKTHTKRTEKFSANDSCRSCGTCESICPKGNIRLEGGKPVFGKECIGCLSCVQYCPEQAINIGKVTLKRERYHNPNVPSWELNKEILHIE